MSEKRNPFLESLKVNLAGLIDTYNKYKFDLKDKFFEQALSQHEAIAQAFPDLDFYTVARIKSYESSMNKLKNKGVKNVYDIHGVKHVLRGADSDVCYKVKEFLETEYYPSKNIKLVKSRTKDYIANPKSNHYQAIHQSANDNGRRFETQIKTDLMEKIARFGEASHADVYKPRTLGNYPTTKVPEYMVISGKQVRHLTFEECFQYFYNINFKEYVASQQKDRG